MKWIEINKARGLKFQQPVFVKDNEDRTFQAKLVKKEDDGAGIVHSFEVATFAGGEYIKDGDLVPTIVTNITHVAIP
jgi:hypothetical protein